MSREAFGVRPRSLDEAVAIIERLLTVIADQQDRITTLETRVAEQRAEITALRAQMTALTERPLTPAGPRGPGPRAGARDGRRCGRAGEAAPVSPGAGLRGSDPTPRRHQVTELPPVQPTITEYQLHTLTCAQCGVTTTASWPGGVPRGVLGPRLVAIVAVCTGVYHLSKRTTVGLLSDLFHVPVGVGTISACEQTVSGVLAAPVAAAQAYVQQAAVVHADETGWREGRQRAWLWVAVTALVTVFLIHHRRSALAARALLGASAAFLVSDRWSAYGRWPLARRQLSWAHLRREFVAFTERGGAAARLGRALLRDTHRMFTWWHRVRDGTWTRRQLQTAMRPLRYRVERQLRRGAVCGHAATAATCRDLLALTPALWTFVDVPDVDPTNNAAERADLGVARRVGHGRFGVDASWHVRSRSCVRLLVSACVRPRRARQGDLASLSCWGVLGGPSARTP